MMGMGGGIGTTRVFGWPLSDWAVVMLLFVISVLTIAFLGAAIEIVAGWFRRPEDAAPPQRKAEETSR